jgi:L-ascorbate metabolism protein UlaG (beta-lactamase superfamily)
MVYGGVMKITKYEHACLIIEQNGNSLIIDPGTFTTDLVIPDAVIAVVITHEHADHLNLDHLHAIVDKNPDAVILAHQDVTTKLGDFKIKSVVPNEGIKIGEFELEFFGGQHAVIVKDWPVAANLGVMVNKRLYYPGDSFAIPDEPVEILALPIAAPWLKFSEVADFLTAVKPKLAFPTHDAILSESGKSLPDNMLPSIAEQVGTKYQRLNEPLDI